MIEDSKTQVPALSEREGGKLRQFYYHSGVRENCFCVKNPKYRMAPLPTSEARERECLRGVGDR